jgi:predicted dehydrogenase
MKRSYEYRLYPRRPAGAARLELEHFFECVAQGDTPVVTGADGRRSLEVVLAAEQSIAGDCTVYLHH